MGAKGPIFIMIMGVAGLVCFGLMAKLLLDESPRAQAVVEYRSQLQERYGADRVDLVGHGDTFEIVLYGGEPLSGSRDRSPASDPAVANGKPSDRETAADPVTGAAAFAHDFREALDPTPMPAVLEVRQMDTGSGCRGAQERWSDRYDFEVERKRLADRLTKLMGAPCQLSTLAGELRVMCDKRGRRETAQQAATVARTLWGGGWSPVVVRLGGRVFRFK